MESQDKGFLEKFFRHPWIIVLAIGTITIFFAFQLPRAELENNNIRFVPENDEARQINRYIDETFGSSFFILLGLERKYGDVFDAAFLNRIREFNRKMEDLDIAGNVNSIVSSDYIYAEGSSPLSGDEGSIVVRKLVDDDFSGTMEEIASLKERLLSWDIYRRALVSDDFSSTQILIPLNITTEQASSPEIMDSFMEIRRVAKETFKGYAEVYVSGLPMIMVGINEAMRADLKTMIPLVTLVVLLILFFSFRRFTAVILPLITVLVASVWSIGAMPLFGIKLSVITTVLPVILVAVGSAYGIHMVTHYLEDSKNRTAGASFGLEEHRFLILSLIRKIGKAVFLAALTTVAGFSSFCFTTVIPIREFGLFSTFGVLVAFLMAIALIPSLLLIRGPSKPKIGGRPGSAFAGSIANPSLQAKDFDLGIARFFSGIAHNRGAVLFTAVLVILVSVRGVSKVVIDNIFIEYFKTSTDISRSDSFIREKFGGSKIVSVVVQADTTEALLMPDVLVAVDGLHAYLEDQVAEAGKVMGFTDLVKRINQVFNADESPEGIRAAATAPGSINDGFGFDDFGFGSFEDSASVQTDNGASGSFIAGQPEEREDKLDAAGMVTLLRQAASSGKTRSMDAGTLVWEMEKLINYEGAAYYEIPSLPQRYGKTLPLELSQLVANYLILLSGNISSYANDSLSPTAIKSTVQLRTLGNEDTGRAIDSIRQYIADHFPPGVRTVIGGTALVENSLNHLIVQSQVISVIISVFIVFLIIALSYRSLVAGIVGIAPLSICILVNFAVMGFLGIKLNIGTSMVASVSVGIGIDYTIHYIEAYRREYLAMKGEGDFLSRTFASSGKAILINAVSVGAGFAVLLFSQFIMLQDLGLLIALTMGSSALASLTVLPVLLLLINPKFIRKEL